MTTGPLGQGISNAVGMAIASKQLAATYNREGLDIVDNKIWCFTGDGCLQEGVGQEGMSFLEGCDQVRVLTFCSHFAGRAFGIG